MTQLHENLKQREGELATERERCVSAAERAETEQRLREQLQLQTTERVGDLEERCVCKCKVNFICLVSNGDPLSRI